MDAWHGGDDDGKGYDEAFNKRNDILDPYPIAGIKRGMRPLKVKSRALEHAFYFGAQRVDGIDASASFAPVWCLSIDVD